MVWRVIDFLFIPVSIWMVIGSYKQIKKKYGIESDSDFISELLWVVLVVYGALNLITYSLFNSSIVFKMKYW